MKRSSDLAQKENSETKIMNPYDSFRDMERMFRDFFYSPLATLRQPERWLGEANRFMPAVDLKETENEIILVASLPGMEKENIDIDVSKDSITITGESKTTQENPNEKYHVKQMSQGSFNICYSLPSEVKDEEVKATYKNGVLEVTMPKAQVTQARKVSVED